MRQYLTTRNVVVGGLLVAIVVLTIAGLTKRTGKMDAVSVESGKCFNSPTDDLLGTFTKITVVHCTEPHDMQMIAKIDYEGDIKLNMSSSQAREELLLDRCDEKLKSARLPSGVDLRYVILVESNYDYRSPGHVKCALRADSRVLTQSVFGA